MGLTLMIDFDGVLRHWAGTDIQVVASKHGLNAAALFDAAFETSRLNRAITGKTTHAQWQSEVHQVLSETYDESVADQLINAWQNAHFDIDWHLFESLPHMQYRLVLVTNATSQLPKDLQRVGLQDRFDCVINSSELGVAKPNKGLYEQALRITNANPSSTLFIDDHLENVITAREMGFHAHHHTCASSTLAWIRDRTIAFDFSHGEST